MDTYSWLRELADSWVLLAMASFYIGAIIWAFRPGSRETDAQIAGIPLRNDIAADRDAAPMKEDA